MAELKVRVDGVSRVVCGVTETTSCQDVVIALAHAMGRTGRFTLIEKWRDSERPLLPTDCPLQVLHKWGEYANEVQLLLHQSDKKEQVSQQQQHLNKIDPGPVPTKEKDTGIRRVLTFSGAHNSEVSNRPPYKIPKQRQYMGRISEDQHSRLTNEITNSQQGQRSREDVHYKPDNQNFHPAFRDKENVLVNGGNVNFQDVKKGLRPGQNGIVHRYPTPPTEQVQSQPNVVPNNRIDHRNPKRMEARVNPIQRNSPRTTHSGDQSATSALFPPHSKQRYSEESVSRGDQVNRTRQPSPHIDNVRASAFQRVVPNRQTSPYRSKEPEVVPDQNGEVEEYDLDSNFPNLPRERVMLEEYRMPGDGHHDNSLIATDHKERVKLQRLVSMQQERLKMQESQISIIDTELSSLEAKQKEESEEIEKITSKIKELEDVTKKYEVEISELDSTSWVDIIEAEKQKEKKIHLEIKMIKDKTTTKTTEIEELNSRIPQVQKDIEKEKTEMEQEAKQRKEEEEKMVEEIKSVKEKLDVENKKIDTDNSELETVENELRDLQNKLDQQKEEVTSLEKQLKDVNLKDFQFSPGPKRKNKSVESGEAVLKILEGRMSPIKGLSGKITPVLSVAKDPDGVWV
ncbi:uncharacterized protein LOC134259568 [Saccostrea cucullata]|uniref:uncharacterized protein LOC134259568 n=1 Tax=Saccostrea cuccullata TaxID=36930 RepID=UPI002ED3E440